MVRDAQTPNMSTSCNWSVHWEILDLVSGYLPQTLRGTWPPPPDSASVAAFMLQFPLPVLLPGQMPLIRGLALHQLASICPQILENLSQCLTIFEALKIVHQFVCAWVDVCKVEQLDGDQSINGHQLGSKERVRDCTLLPKSNPTSGTLTTTIKLYISSNRMAPSIPYPISRKGFLAKASTLLVALEASEALCRFNLVTVGCGNLVAFAITVAHSCRCHWH